MRHFPANMKEYHKAVDEALNDSFLRKTLDTFAVEYRASRDSVFSEVDEHGLIARIASVKDDVARHLEELYEQFKTEAEKRGVHVHRAATAAEANAIISRIASRNGVKRIIKSKSMTAEETGLNEQLTKDGFTVDETDLGEWIIQLRKETPSHMVLPAIHLSRYQVAEDFSRETGIKQDPEDIQKLVKVARTQLRRKFVAADMGISGANFAIAETGSLVLVTNEGNARLCTTLPRIHVALVGLDKLMPTLDDVLNALLVLPRNGTSQRITSYVSFICGAGECQANRDNRKDMHIVFLDNGRSRLAKDPLFSQIFRCVRCGACANVCPVFRLIGGHRMGHVYIGAIGLILTYLYHDRDAAKILCQSCIGCEACKNVCSGGINLPLLIREIRARFNEMDGAPMEAALLGRIMADRKLFHRLLRYIRFSQRPVAGTDGFVRHLPAVLMGHHNYKSLPVLAKHPFRELWPDLRPRISTPRFRIALFAGCAQDFIYPEQLEAAVKLFARYGVAVDFPMSQTCCGLPLVMMGQDKVAADVARQNIEAFAGDYDAIVTLCASCASHLKNGYLDLPGIQSESFSNKIMDFSSFVHDMLGLDAKDFLNDGEKTTYHAACHLCRGLGVREAPRALISKAADYVPCAEEEVCCGFGGTYSAKFPEISAQLLQKKLDNITRTGATRLVADCPGCIMQIRGGVHKHNMPVKVTHIAELLAENLKKES